MRGRGAPASAWRFAKLESYRNDNYRQNFANPSATSAGLAAGARFLAAGTGTGNILVLPLDYKDYKRSDRPPVINAHGSATTDFQFSPHDDLLLATCATGSLKTFQIPVEGLTEELKDPMCEVQIGKAPLCLKWHPSASQIIAVGAKNALFIVDVGAGEIKYQFEAKGYGNEIVSVAWSTDGSQLAALNKKGVLAIGDVRTADDTFLTGGINISGTFRQPQSVFFMKNNKLCVMGLDKTRKPSIAWYSEGAEEKKATLQSMSSGFCLPMYDEDTDLLFLTCRGSSSVTIYDVAESKGIVQFTALSTSTFEHVAKGACLIAKRAVNAFGAEIQRIYVQGSGALIPHGIKIPRKKIGFAPELFPDALDAVPALTAEAYLSGENSAPNRVSMESPLANTSWASPESCASPASPASPPAATVDAVPEEAVPEEAAPAKSAFPARQVSETRAALDEKFAVSLFTHVAPSEPDKMDRKNYWFDAKPGKNMILAQNVVCNDTFFAFPWKTNAGSAVCVMTWTGPKGRFKTKQPVIRGHTAQVNNISLSSHDPTALLSSSPDMRIMIHRIPEGGMTGDISTAELDIAAPGRVSRLLFHPYVSGVFVSAAHTMRGDDVISFHDAKTGDVHKEIEFFEGVVEDFAFHPNCKWMAVSSKDSKIRVIDVVTNSVLKTFECLEAKRETRVLWLGDKVVTVGFGARSRRSFSLWDISDEPRQLMNHVLSNANYVPMPHLDAENSVLYIGQYGSSSVDVFEFKPRAPWYEMLKTATFNSECRGMAFAHNSTVDVKNVEVGRAVNITNNSLVPISWRLPRRRREYFQDDVLPPVVSPEAVFDSEAFFEWDGDSIEIKMVSRRPEGMPLLSEAPKEGPSKKAIQQAEYLRRQREAEKIEEQSNEAVEMMDTETYTSEGNRWDARGDNANEIDDAAWGSDSD
jgi:coronin-7